MLNLLHISNIALIQDLKVEFGEGLNLLTGETGSGKSIIVDAVGGLTGGRFGADMLKSGASRGFAEGLFTLPPAAGLSEVLDSAGIGMERDELIVRRELSEGGRGKVFVNSRLTASSVLRELRPYLVDIHGQGDQQTLFNPDTHLDLLDSFAGLEGLRGETAQSFAEMSRTATELSTLKRDQAQMLQLQDILRFQIDEITRAGAAAGEDERLEEEKRRLANVEKLSALSAEAFSIVYDAGDSAVARVVQALRRVEELSQYQASFRAYTEALASARAMLEDLGLELRDFREGLEVSPGRLAEVESRLVEISSLKRKYGGSIETVLDHLAKSEVRLRNILHSEDRQNELAAAALRSRNDYLALARRLHDERHRRLESFENATVASLSEVAMEHSRFEVQIETPPATELDASIETRLSVEPGPKGIDRIEFLFSANPGEPVKPLAKVASGGEASRLMLVLKTIANASRFPRTIVFDEIDTGIGGRVSEAVGAKLKALSRTNQVLCVTHQPQIARFADCHYSIRKQVVKGLTEVSVERLDRKARIEELARMLTGAAITDSARRHARELLKT